MKSTNQVGMKKKYFLKINPPAFHIFVFSISSFEGISGIKSSRANQSLAFVTL